MPARKTIKNLDDLYKLAESKGKEVKYLYACGDGTGTYRVGNTLYTFDKNDNFVRIEK